MLYYKVREDKDLSLIKNNRLIQGELLTNWDIEELGLIDDTLFNYAHPVAVESANTHKVAGRRFEKPLKN